MTQKGEILYDVWYSLVKKSQLGGELVLLFPGGTSSTSSLLMRNMGLGFLSLQQHHHHCGKHTVPLDMVQQISNDPLSR